MKKLTLREKNLLFVFGLIIIVGLGVSFWLLPTSAEIESLRLENTELNQQKTVMENTTALTSSYEQNIETRKQEITDILDRISGEIQLTEFERYLAGLAQQVGISVTSVNYGQIAPTTPTASQSDVTDIEYSLKALIDEYRNYEQQTNETIVAEYEVLVQNIQIAFDGSENSLRSFISEINGYRETLYIRQVQYDYENSTATVNLDIYFVEKEPAAETEAEPAD